MQQLEKTLVVSLENEMTDFTAAHELLRPVGQGVFEAGFIGELVYERGSQGVDYGRYLLLLHLQNALPSSVGGTQIFL